MGVCASQEPTSPRSPPDSPEMKHIVAHKSNAMYGIQVDALLMHTLDPDGDDPDDGSVKMHLNHGGEMREVRMRLDEACASIKMRLYEKSIKEYGFRQETGVAPPLASKLRFKGEKGWQTIKDGRTLQDYDVGGGATLHFEYDKGMIIHIILPGIVHDVVVWPQEPVSVMLVRVLSLLGEDDWISHTGEQIWRILWRPEFIPLDTELGELRGAGQSKLFKAGVRIMPAWGRLLMQVYDANDGPHWDHKVLINMITLNPNPDHDPNPNPRKIGIATSLSNNGPASQSKGILILDSN